MRSQENCQQRKENVSAHLIDEDEVLDMEVGQDIEFVSENKTEEETDQESNVVTFNNSKEKESSCRSRSLSKDQTIEDKDEDWDRLVEHNCEIADLNPHRSEQFSNTGESQMINLAVDKIQEVFMNSEFMERANKMQIEMKKQLEESQRKFMEQTIELEKLQKQAKENERGKTTINSQERNRTQERQRSLNEILSQASSSELTIYRSAVENLISKRDSSSSEDGLNSSDEMRVRVVNENTEDEMDIEIASNHSMIDQFISDSRDRHRQRSERETRYIEDGQQPNTSGYVPNSRRNLEQPMG